MDITTDMISTAWALVLPIITELVERNLTPRSDLVVMVWLEGDSSDPRSYYQLIFGADVSVEGCKLSEIARAKVRTSLAAQMDSGDAIRYPHLIPWGGAKGRGGVYLHGVVVGASGFEGPQDEAIATALAAMILCLLRQQLDKVKTIILK